MLSHEVWADVVPTLAEEYDVVAATLPGHWGGPHLWRRTGIAALIAEHARANREAVTRTA